MNRWEYLMQQNKWKLLRIWKSNFLNMERCHEKRNCRFSLESTGTSVSLINEYLNNVEIIRRWTSKWVLKYLVKSILKNSHEHCQGKFVEENNIIIYSLEYKWGHLVCWCYLILNDTNISIVKYYTLAPFATSSIQYIFGLYLSTITSLILQHIDSKVA